MIALRPMRATLAWLLMLLAGCAATPPAAPSSASLPSRLPPEIAAQFRPGPVTDQFTMDDGAVLPVRSWLPDGPPRAVILALHGFNDSRDAWELPAPAFTNAFIDAGYALYAPDQRGFGAAPGRGRWPGVHRLVEDAANSAALLRARYPHTELVLMGESMGGAVLMALQAGPLAVPADRVVLLAPAVWDRGTMNPLMRVALWLGATIAPDLTLGASDVPMHITPSDNEVAMARLWRDPLTIRRTSLASLRGLVNLMDAAQAAAAEQRPPTLLLYGGADDMVPPAPMREAFAALPSGVRRAFYPGMHHLLLRDLGRAGPIGDILAFIANPDSALPSGADHAAIAWIDSGS